MLTTPHTAHLDTALLTFFFSYYSTAPRNWESLYCRPSVEAGFLRSCSYSMSRIWFIIIYRLFSFVVFRFIYFLCVCRSEDNLLELILGLEFRSQGLAASTFITWSLLLVPSFLFLFSFLTLDLTLQHVHNDFLLNKESTLDPVTGPFSTHGLIGLVNVFFSYTLS